MNRLAPIFVSCLLAAGCSDESPPPPGPSGPLITIDNIQSQFYDALCDFAVNCEMEIGKYFTDHAACEDLFRVLLSSDPSSGIFSVENIADRYTVNSTAAEACLGKIRGLACSLDDLDFDNDPDCSRAVEGLLAEDTCCDLRGGCAPALECERPNRADTGTCQPEGQLDESCWTRECAAGFYCDTSGMTPLCKRERSVSQSCNFSDEQCGPGMLCDLMAMGGPACVVTMEGSPCFLPSNCPDETDFHCGFNGMAQVCMRRILADQPCGAMDKCVAGYACITGTCQRPDLGDECNPNDDNCPAFFGSDACTPDGTMFVCKAPGQLDDVCDPMGSSEPTCAWGQSLHCDPATSMCADAPRANDPCTDLCQPIEDLYCDTSMGPTNAVCRPRLAAAGTCVPGANDPGCQIGLRCDPMTSRCRGAFNQCP